MAQQKLQRIILEITDECWEAVRKDLNVPNDASKRVATHTWRDSLYEKYGLTKPVSAEERYRMKQIEERMRKVQAEYDDLMKRGVTPSKESDKGSEGATGGDTSVSESSNGGVVESEVVKDENKGSGKRGNSGKSGVKPPRPANVTSHAKPNATSQK